MTSNPMYLRNDIQVEPLFDRWYAWSHLISPATAARNITERHLKIMDSYIGAPKIHANAVANPKMSGGPFIDYGGGRVEEIKALRERTKSSRADLLALSQALAELDALLNAKATGICMTPLYESVPPLLGGFVELCYDLYNHPSYRLIEPLLYRSKFYDVTAQSLMLRVTAGDDRPFVLSTPRLDDDATVELQVPFRDERIDKLFCAKRKPVFGPQLHDLLDAANGRSNLMRSFFTSEPPRPYQPYTGQGMRWRYFGHACILIETRDVSMLFDPVLSYTYENSISRYTYEDLPEHIDYVLITHNHQDHILFETILQIRNKVGTFVVPRANSGALQDPSVKLILEQTGCRNVIELGELDTVPFANGAITGLPFLGEHADLGVHSKLAYLVQIGKRKLMFAADSCNIEPRLYRHVHNITGDVDVLFVGMECDGAPLSWLYGPLLSKKNDRSVDESRRLAGSNFDQAVDIVKRFNCSEVYVYAMGQEPWLNYVMSIKYTPQSRPIIESEKLIAACREQGIVAERLLGEKEIFMNV